MSLENKDIFLVLIGFAANIVASAVWDWWKKRSKSAKYKAEFEEKFWSERLNNTGFIARNEAATEILIRSFYWFILGNVIFAVSGLAWALDLTGIYGFQSVFASATSFGALFLFAGAMKWVRLYMRVKFSQPVPDKPPAKVS